MDAKVTLSFNDAVITRAKHYADANNVSLSRLVEFLLDKVTAGGYPSLEDFPIADWVSMVAEGRAEYITKAPSSKKRKDTYFKSKK
jgi:hypothetical protein